MYTTTSSDSLVLARVSIGLIHRPFSHHDIYTYISWRIFVAISKNNNEGGLILGFFDTLASGVKGGFTKIITCKCFHTQFFY